jgi:hypothetical protein
MFIDSSLTLLMNTGSEGREDTVILSASEGSSRSSQPRPPTTFDDPSLTLRMMIVHGSLQRPGVVSQLLVNNRQVHPLMDGALARRWPALK